MLLVLGSACDDQPFRLAKRWAAAGRDVAVATPADLSRPGWRLRVGRPCDTRAAVGDRVVTGDAIGGVVNALGWIGPYDLAHVVEDDRDYVGQEMVAFLLAWMGGLACPVIDSPTPVCLAGCGRSNREWAALAQKVSVRADPDCTEPTVGVTVVGGRAVNGPRGCADAAQDLAKAARRQLVTLRFAAHHAHPLLVGGDLRPEVGDDAAADALLAWFDRQ